MDFDSNLQSNVMVDLLSLLLNMCTHTLRKPRRCSGRPVRILGEVQNRAHIATVADARDREKLGW